jgi:flavin-dependent dehydrogenase
VSRQYDAVIVGGGPAGSTVATFLARAGRRVLVLERERFPRFHVGESLLPYTLPIFERLGVAEKIRRAGFQEKYGAFFWNEKSGTTRPVVFGNAFDDRHPMAYQVKRADFDDLLLKHAAESGADVLQETAVEDILFKEGRAVGVRAISKQRGAQEIFARAVVDASGMAALLSTKLGTRRLDARLKRAALFAHYEGIQWPEGHQRGDILLPVEDRVWYWIIPFSDGTSSVGAVFESSLARETGAPGLEARFDALLARSTRMPTLLEGSRRTSRVFAISDYSASSARMGGDGFVLVGDAATFLDPVFSTGVFLALATGERAARAVDRALARHGRLDRKDLAGYEREASKLFRRFRAFVYNFYDPVFLEGFCSPDPPEAMRKAVTTILAGGVERPSLAVVFWTRLMLSLVGFDRFQRRLREWLPRGKSQAAC